MIPETSSTNEVALYIFDSFPSMPRKIRVLLNGHYVDTSPFKVDDTWFILTTSSSGLELFYTDDLVRGELKPHPCSPITTDRRFFRSGGGVLNIDNQLFRIAQNCNGRYGMNISIIKINEVSRETYAEQVAAEDIFECADYWNTLGVHHVSAAQFAGGVVLAVDGHVHDYLLHRMLASIVKRCHAIATRWILKTS
jgi:hypothetical protein